jgi:hypothetical protein
MPPDAPIPEAVAVAYAMPDTSDIRPGIVTALGVSSIVVAVMQAGTAIMVCFMAFALYIMSAMPPPQPYQPTVASTNFPNGLPIERAAMLSNRMTEIANLTSKRHDSLDALLRQSGRDIAPNMLNGDINTASVKRFIVSNARTSEGHDLFLVAAGRIELSDTEATFEPEGSTEIVTVETAKMALNVIVPTASGTSAAVNARPQVKVGALAQATWYLTSITSGLLCILLLIAGIMTLRGAKGGRRAHLWWAWLKLPIAILGAIGVGWMFAVFAEVGAAKNAAPGAPIGPPAADSVVAGVVMAVIQGCLSVAYIAAVIIAMNLRHVRAWYATR